MQPGKYIATIEIKPLKIFYSGEVGCVAIEKDEEITVLCSIPTERTDEDGRIKQGLLIKCSDGAIFVIDEFTENFGLRKPRSSFVNASYFTCFEGGVEVGTPCKYNPETGEVKNIVTCQVEGCDMVEREYITVEEGKYVGSTAEVELCEPDSYRAFFDKKHKLRCTSNKV